MSASQPELNAFTRCLAHHFPDYYENQVELLAMMVYVLLNAKDVRHAALAERWPSGALTTLLIRRIERFFNHHPICPADLARVVLTLLPDARQREFVLDRTNWKLGKQDVNILVRAVIWQGVAVPLLFECLDHQGNSSTYARLLMIDDVLNLLDCHDVKTIYADREFIGEDWIMGLAERGIPLTVRSSKRHSNGWTHSGRLAGRSSPTGEGAASG